MDDLFDALADSRRRALLVTLLEQNPGEVVQVPDCLQEGEQELEVLKMELFHIHLPKLQQAGLIHWDQDTSEIGRGQRFEEIRPFLDVVADNANGSSATGSTPAIVSGISKN